jgi:hypothetical protein
MELLWAIAVHAGQWAAAYLLLDLFFLYLPVQGELKKNLAWAGRLYHLVGFLFTLAGGYLQWRWAGAAGLFLAALGWLPWWMLWRFGVRKQFSVLVRGPADR